MTDSLAQLIQAAQGDRGRLNQILLRLQSGEQLLLRISDWSQLARELQRLGCFAQVLELCDLASAQGVEDFDLLAKSATAASNLGLTGDFVERLERAEAILPDSAFRGDRGSSGWVGPAVQVLGAPISRPRARAAVAQEPGRLRACLQPDRPPVVWRQRRIDVLDAG
ncbi:MAG: hypothetical protein IPK97_04380 [Ahniella sp.]|nr:hypothetical protein [Ahniella sp.]